MESVAEESVEVVEEQPQEEQPQEEEQQQSVRHGTLRDKLVERMSTYQKNSCDKYAKYIDVFIKEASNRMLDAIEAGQLSSNSYSINIFDYTISESRVFFAMEQQNCPSDFYQKIIDYFKNENISCTIVQSQEKTPELPLNQVTFTWE